jgi:FixJ family two-component response regulator
MRLETPPKGMIRLALPDVLTSFSNAPGGGAGGLAGAMTEASVVHVIDDDQSLRTVLGSLFRSVGLQPELYETVGAFMGRRPAQGPECLVLDIRLPGVSGLDFQSKLASLGIAMPVILMTGHGDIPMTVRGMKAGAVDFLTKPFRDQDMLDAVASALERDRKRQGVAARIDELRARYATLSPREQQVMALVAAGKMNKQVAGDLNLSLVTIKIHRGSAMRKMGARSLADLVRMAEALTVPNPKQKPPPPLKA